MAFLRSLVLLVATASAVVQMVGAQTATDPNGIRVDRYRIVFNVKCTTVPKLSIPNPFIVPDFTNAKAELRCGENYDVIINRTTTDRFGIGQFSIDPKTALPILPLESDCKIVVTTSLSTCNPALPSTGRLEAKDVQYVYTGIIPPIIAVYTAYDFKYNPNLN